MQHTHGYVATIVSGKITYQNGKSTAERPGSLVKSVKDTKQTHEFAN
jgi:N-acyl-D-aspartate/D-glutamate deacylase